MRKITLKEACEILSKHKIIEISKPWRDDELNIEDQWVKLDNGCRLVVESEISGPYSEATPDVDSEINIVLYEKGEDPC